MCSNLHVGGAPVEGGAQLEEEGVTGAELVLGLGGGRAAQHAVLSAEGQQLLDCRHLEIQSYKKYKYLECLFYSIFGRLTNVPVLFKKKKKW